MLEPVSTGVAITLLVKSASTWLPAISDAFVPPVRDAIVGKITERTFNRLSEQRRKLFHLDEKEQKRHLELALKNAAERGLARFQTTEEQKQYNEVINLLSTSHADALRREAMPLLTLNDQPDFGKLNSLYYQLRSQTQLGQGKAVDVMPYLRSFFGSLVAELYSDPYFRQQMNDVLHVRAGLNMQRSLTEVLSTLNQIGETLADNYTPEQFEEDVKAYTEHIERTLRYLKLVGVLPKEHINENRDPELDGIFVPLHIAMQSYFLLGIGASDSLVELLERNVCMLLLGGPGAGKSTSTRHLAWSHALANLPNSTSLTNAPLLSGKPLPLRIELRRLNEDRRQRPDYDFLTYASEVLLGRSGVNIPPHMFELLLERRTMMVLFDGLDEVATLEDRRTLVEEIETFVQCYPGNRFLVTSRPVGYELAPLSQQIFSHAQVQPFNDKQIHAYLENWYVHVLRLSPLSPDDQQELEELYTALKDNPRLRSLASNPLLLTVITALHHYERLPDRRILVYDRCADLLLETWAKLKGTNKRWQDLKLSKDDQYACVAHLGFELHKRSQPETGYIYYEDGPEETDVDVPLKFMLREIERFLQRQNSFPSVAEQNKQASRLLDLIKEEAGLIVERGTGENNETLYGFVHRTFQEYFAAVDIYERYQQEEDSAIISNFLREHLHNPHWHEVILLLFGKLKRGPATKQLRQILEGKIESLRSKYTNVVQQDLFFVCSCLTEEINVEYDLALSVVGRLSQLAQISPFPSQRLEALEVLGALMRTRQYAYLGRKELEVLIAQNSTLDISTKLEAIRIVYLNGPIHSEEKQRATEMILQLAKDSNASLENALRAAWTLYKISPDHSNEDQQSYQILAELVQHPNLSFEQVIHTIQYLLEESIYLWSKKELVKQLLLKLAHQAHFSVEQAIQIALAFKSDNLDPFLPDFPDEDGEVEDKKVLEIKEIDLVVFFLSELVRLPNLTSEQALKIFRSFLNLNQDVNAQLVHLTSHFLKALQQSDLLFEQTIDYIQALYQINQAPKNLEFIANRFLLKLAQRSDLSVKQTIQIVQLLYSRLSAKTDLQKNKEVKQVNEMLLALSNRSDLSVEETIQVLMALYSCGYLESQSLKPQQYFQIYERLKQIYEGANSTFEQNLRVIKAVYKYSFPHSPERRWATQNLLNLAPQNLQAALALYEHSSPLSQAYKLASQSLSDLIQYTDTPTEQFVQSLQSLCEKVQYLYESAHNEANIPELQEVFQISIQILSNLVQRSELPADQIIQVIGLLYKYSFFELEEERERLTQLLWGLAQNHSFSRDQKVQIVMLPIQSIEASFSDKVSALEIILSLLPKEEARSYLQHYVNPAEISAPEIAYGGNIKLLDISIVVELSKQELLPNQARDELYQVLGRMVPQFGNLTEVGNKKE